MKLLVPLLLLSRFEARCARCLVVRSVSTIGTAYVHTYKYKVLHCRGTALNRPQRRSKLRRLQQQVFHTLLIVVIGLVSLDQIPVQQQQ